MKACDEDAVRTTKFSGHENPSIITNFYYDYCPKEDKKDFNQRRVGRSKGKWTDDDWTEGEEQHRPCINPVPFSTAEKEHDPEAAFLGRVEDMVAEDGD